MQTSPAAWNNIVASIAACHAVKGRIAAVGRQSLFLLLSLLLTTLPPAGTAWPGGLTKE